MNFIQQQQNKFNNDEMSFSEYSDSILEYLGTAEGYHYAQQQVIEKNKYQYDPEFVDAMEQWESITDKDLELDLEGLWNMED